METLLLGRPLLLGRLAWELVRRAAELQELLLGEGGRLLSVRQLVGDEVLADPIYRE
jgi:hypothetical protein